MLLNFEPDCGKSLHCNHSDLGDEPDKHRWRASWVTAWDESLICGIQLDAYPVLRLTPTGAWIDPVAMRQATKQPWEDGAPGMEWITHLGHKRWVGNVSGSAWAKRTKEDAILSIAIRLTRWAQKCANDHARAMAAVETLRVLRPDMPSYADNASWTLRSITLNHRAGKSAPEALA